LNKYIKCNIKYRCSRATVDSYKSWAGMCTCNLNLSSWPT